MWYGLRDTKTCSKIPTTAVASSLADRLFYCPKMKKIECYIRESDMKPLVEALAKTGIGGVTAYPVQGFGRQRGKGQGQLINRFKIEVFALDMEIDYVLGTILQITRRNDFGAGKIAILPVDEVIRIRTGEKGAKAVF
jgi:nitrogen regulatory protein P-II 1